MLRKDSAISFTQDLTNFNGACFSKIYLSKINRPNFVSRPSLASTNRNRNSKLEISRAPTKAKSREPAYLKALNQNKIDRQRSKSRESGRQTLWLPPHIAYRYGRFTAPYKLS